MNVISRVRIKGFWGDKCVDFYPNPYVNFLIGVNGSGKTTFINLIAATLSVDIYTLAKIEFSEIELNFYLSELKAIRIIRLEKSSGDGRAFTDLTYRFSSLDSPNEQNTDTSSFSIENVEEYFAFRKRLNYMESIPHYSKSIMKVKSQIDSFVKTSWLSIHRVTPIDYFSIEESFESSVDRKLDELGVSLSKYFSELSSNVSAEISKFQTDMIAKLLLIDTDNSSFSDLITEIDFDDEKESFNQIFKQLKLSPLKGFDAFFDRAKKAQARHQEGGTYYGTLKDGESAIQESLRDILCLLNCVRNHGVVQSWNKLLEKQDEILKPKCDFLDVLNGMLQKKQIQTNSRNELIVKSQSGKIFSIMDLSSGEKQLVIILGQALLQGTRPSIYIADEPELSLHVSWQEALIPNVRTLNPAAQIMCATHSPDIVGPFSEYVTNMEDIISE